MNIYRKAPRVLFILLGFSWLINTAVLLLKYFELPTPDWLPIIRVISNAATGVGFLLFLILLVVKAKK
jgi:hypothetical protein